MGDVMDQENSENTIGTYDHIFAAEACLPDEQGGGGDGPESPSVQRTVRVTL